APSDSLCGCKYSCSCSNHKDGCFNNFYYQLIVIAGTNVLYATIKIDKSSPYFIVPFPVDGDNYPGQGIPAARGFCYYFIYALVKKGGLAGGKRLSKMAGDTQLPVGAAGGI